MENNSDNQGNSKGYLAFFLILILIIGIFSAIILIKRPDIYSDVKKTGKETKKQIINAKWEYKIIGFEDENVEKKINELGTEGWKLVFARRALSDNHGIYEMIFKRKK